VDADRSWLLSASLIDPALPAPIVNIEVAFVSLPKVGSRLATHMAYSREHSG